MKITKKDCVKIEGYTEYICDPCYFHEKGTRIPAEYKTIKSDNSFAGKIVVVRPIYFCEKCYNKLTE